ncbi:hypothetical protein ABOM_009078 [Aspergillus bombycis]|uniref:Glucose/galactose transporter n=1 Tax=Aspergillus bombycis TaxID=109264 RepID=A0A1F7ZS22_9EURO|nr:hypothetical protein ABOM_009078 [Aspergillus bombycis]OGM42243.1 hypothetical protein ABOM_009078 [Aspergillus bombycis]
MWRRKITVDDKAITDGVGITLKQSLFPWFLGKSKSDHPVFPLGLRLWPARRFEFHFQAELNITTSMASGLSAAYFGAYVLCPLTISGWILRRYGFRVTFMVGLAVLAVGCLLFWPSGVKASFGGFCGSMFVVGAGLSTLETGADSFLSICGPPRYSEIRLNLAQGVQGIGSFAAPILASRVFFANTVDTQQGLKNVQWESGYSSAMSSNLLAIGQGLYAFNRFVASGFITLGLKPRYILAVYLALCFVFGLAATLTHGATSVAMLILVLCFESACFATIFSLALRGLGNHTKRGGSLLVAAISGGAAIPPMTGAVATQTGNFHYAMAIPTAFYVLVRVFPVYTNTASKKFLDGHLQTDLNLNANHAAVEKAAQLQMDRTDSKPGADRVETVNI